MGEMIKYGIKLAITIGAAVALVAAVAILYNLISTAISGLTVVTAISELFGAFTILCPFDIKAIMLAVTALMAYKIAYWVADKLIQLNESTS